MFFCMTTMTTKLDYLKTVVGKKTKIKNKIFFTEFETQFWHHIVAVVPNIYLNIVIGQIVTITHQSSCEL